jgi:hypothetical protein
VKIALIIRIGEEIKDLIEKLCDDFEEMLRKE